MTFRIAKSAIDALPYDYAAAVESFLQAKLAHRFTGDAAPRADAIVEAAVRRVQYPIGDQKPDDFVADYEVFDDVPTPTLAERKAALIGRLRAAEAEAHAAEMSAGRRRLLALDVNEVQAKDPAKRSAKDKKVLAQHEGLIEADKTTHRRFALAEIEIEELTEAKIDGFEKTFLTF